MIITSFHNQSFNDGTSITANEPQLTVGVLAMLGGRIFGFIDAWQSTSAYNQRLRRLMGLPEWLALGMAPIRTRDNVAYAPTLRLSF